MDFLFVLIELFSLAVTTDRGATSENTDVQQSAWLTLHKRLCSLGFYGALEICILLLLLLLVGWKSAFCKGVGQYPPNFHVERYVPHKSFSHG